MVQTQRILIVEDDLGIREFLAEKLREYDIEFARHQKEAYERLRTPEFDLVLLDLRLPRDPGDMNPTNEVGIDILREIRKRRLTKRASAMLMPVVVMTAYGEERLPAQLLVGIGANDYIPKPFGSDGLLEGAIQRAIAGDGALVPAANIVGTVVRLAFHPDEALVGIETLRYRGAHFKLLKALGDIYDKDWQARRAQEKFAGIRAAVLADILKITEGTAIARVSRFRQEVRRDFRSCLGRAIDDNDIVENSRDWEGYRLNPRVVRVLNWGDLGLRPGDE
jgi:CheY-like chemotaxis protein